MFINGTLWNVIVVTKSMLAKPIINPVNLLHAQLGYIVTSTVKTVVQASLHTGTLATKQQASMQFPTDSCSVCT